MATERGRGVLRSGKSVIFGAQKRLKWLATIRLGSWLVQIVVQLIQVTVSVIFKPTTVCYTRLGWDCNRKPSTASFKLEGVLTISMPVQCQFGEVVPTGKFKLGIYLQLEATCSV